MKSYLISYDLGPPETYADYVSLGVYLRTFPQWAKPLLSVWFIKTPLTAGQLRDEIRLRLDNNDKLLVIEVKEGSWGTSNVSKAVTDWMKINL